MEIMGTMIQNSALQCHLAVLKETKSLLCLFSSLYGKFCIQRLRTALGNPKSSLLVHLKEILKHKRKENGKN